MKQHANPILFYNFNFVQGGDKFLIYVTVTDGHFTMKNEVYVKIKNTTATSPGPPSNRPARPPYYPTYLLPSAPLVPQTNHPPAVVPHVGQLPILKTDRPTKGTKKGWLIWCKLLNKFIVF